MSMGDPIADMLTRIRNTQAVEKTSMVMPPSKLEVAIAKVLKDGGYIDESAVTEQGGKFTLTIGLKYYAGRPVIERLERVLKPGLRAHKGRNEIPRAVNGLDVAIISTSQGLMMDRRVRVAGIGGEVICHVVQGGGTMSCVGKASIMLPKGIEANFTGGLLIVKGPLGILTQPIRSLAKIITDNGTITLAPADESREANALQGTMRVLTANMVKGVTTDLERKLNLVGVGYHASVQDTALKLQPGFSHDVIHEMPDGVKAETPAQTEITIKGSDKQKVGQVAAEVRGHCPPEPYKGRGVRCVDECVTLKGTKKK